MICHFNIDLPLTDGLLAPKGRPSSGVQGVVDDQEVDTRHRAGGKIKRWTLHTGPGGRRAI